MEIKIVSNWCKTFDLDNGALVLFFKEYDSDKDKYLIKVETRFEIEEALVSPTLTMGYDKEETRDEKFNLTDIEMANKVFNSLNNEIIEMIGNEQP